MKFFEQENAQSLNDWPGKIVFPVIIFGCNFSCPFCFVPRLLNSEENGASEDKILEKISKLDKNWYDGILISGGEPTINKDLPEFLKKIKNLRFKIRLFTNGSNPEMIKLLIENNLVDSIAMDVKHKKEKEKYNQSAGASVNFNDIEKSMILVSSLEDYEFRTTLTRKFHTKEDAKEIFLWIKTVIGKTPKFKIQNFYDRAENYVDASFKDEKPFLDSELADLNTLL